MMIVPKPLKDFAFWLNPTNLMLFKKKEVLRDVFLLVKANNYMLDEDVLIYLSEGLNNNPQDKGIFALRVYFYQILVKKTIMVDLRPGQFKFDGNWKLKSKGLNFSFSEKFQSSLIGLYNSYYQDNGPDMTPFLIELGLAKESWPDELKLKVKNLFLEHFNQADSNSQIFSKKDLFRIFTKVFKFLKDNSVFIPSEFVIFGVYLTSLYMVLDNSESYDVKACYKFVAKHSRENKIQ